MSLGPGGAYRGPVISYQWRGGFASAEIEALHAEGFGHAPGDHDWTAQVHRHSLGWVCARRGADLAGFVNVAWDGGGHAFLLDTVVAGPLRVPVHQRRPHQAGHRPLTNPVRHIRR